jgi:hypothetical protein
MSLNDNACVKAARNLAEQIDANARFPLNVFRPTWGKFLFFDSDWMFDSGFVDLVKSLLIVEGAECACLTNLDMTAGLAGQGNTIYIELGTTPANYLSQLRGAIPGAGWIHGIDRFGCTSNICEWTMYCERASEIAVIAIRDQVPVERYVRQISMLKAAPLAQAFEQPLAYGFTGTAMSAAWRDKLLVEYATHVP